MVDVPTLLASWGELRESTLRRMITHPAQWFYILNKIGLRADYKVINFLWG